MNEFRKRLLRNNNQANIALWEKAHLVYDQRLLLEEWELTTDGCPKFEPELEGTGNPRLEAQFDPDQWAAILAKRERTEESK